jgi:7,8-dihydropterin-6-yl-methyl-4-(beta-D-ribofuranosyl)aminobenzene 5'-phosphate synthase
MYNKKDKKELFVMNYKKFFYSGLLLFGLLLITACVSPLLKAENPLTKASTDIPASEIQPSAPPLTVLPAEILTRSESEQIATDTVQTGSQDMIKITIVFDNYPFKDGMETAWGFSALVTSGDQNLLFDTGADGNMLLRNMADLDIKPTQIQNVILSHEHSDHTGGLQALISAGADPVVYLPPSFSTSFKNYYSRLVEVVEVSPGMQIIERMYTIGEMEGPPPEQALVIDTTKGLVVITGCAHPGIEKIVLKAKQEFKEDIYLVLGGFHLGSTSDYQVNKIIQEFNRIGVKYAAPSHCTGDPAISSFREAFGEDFIQVGVGKVIEIEN